MKSILPILLFLIIAVASEPPPPHSPMASKRSMAYPHWYRKNAKQIAASKPKTLMVQIRSDHPVPLIFKGRPGPPTHSHSHYAAHQRRPRPIKISAPIYLKPLQIKSNLRQPLKIKLTNSKPHSKPLAANYEKPYKYEKPAPVSYLKIEADLPSTTKANFIASEHFAPIHTIPAPNLSLHDNHIHQEDTATAIARPQQQPQNPIYHQYKNTISNSNNNNNNNNLENQYQVLEEITNDATFVDPISDSQKFFAPDPDPSLPTTKIRPATEAYNRPSNGRPLPADVQSNHLVPVQPLVQISGAQQAQLTAADIFHPQLTPFLPEHLTAIQAAPLSNYNPTYLVTQSNNLYNQHQQQLFQPHVITTTPQIIEAGYVNADLTQEVASDGQILQSPKPPHRTNEPAYEPLPQFAALIAAPALGAAAQQSSQEIAPFSLPNIASSEPQGGFVISNYYGNNVQDSSQLLSAYAEEEARRQQTEEFELRKQQIQQQRLQQQQLQQQQLEEQQQLHEQQQQFLQQQQQFLQQQQQFQPQQLHQQEQLQQNYHEAPQQQVAHQPISDAASAFEQHQRLVQQHLGNTPLRIFVPDEIEARLQKRSGKTSKQSDPNQQEEPKVQ